MTQIRRAIQARVFAVTWLSYAVYYLARKGFGVVKSSMVEELGISLAAIAVIGTLYQATYAGGQFMNGALADRFGARALLTIGMVGAGAASLAFGLGSSAPFFAGAFALQGLFQSTGWPANVKAMTPFFDATSRGTVMGVWCTSYQVGGIAATALATYLLTHGGWRSSFLWPAAIVGVGGILVLGLLPSPPADATEEPTASGSAGETGSPEQASGDGAAESASSSHPVATSVTMGRPASVRPSLFRQPVVWAYGGGYFGLKLIRYSLLFWLPFYLHEALGYDEGTAGYLSMTFEVGGIFGAIGTGWASDRFFRTARVRLLVPMLLLLAVALVAYQLGAAHGLWVNGSLMALVGALVVGPEALMTTAIPQDLGGSKGAASAAGIINGLGACGAMLQDAVTVSVATTWGWRALFYVFVGLAVLSALALLPIARQHQPEA